MPSPPRSLEEAVQRIAHALADDDGSGWWGEEECGPGHVDAARRLAEAGGVSVLLERLEEVEQERHQLGHERDSLLAGFEQQKVRATSAEARVASLERENEWLALERDEARFRPGLGDNHHNAAACPYCNPERKSSALAQGAAAPLPGDTE